MPERTPKRKFSLTFLLRAILLLFPLAAQDPSGVSNKAALTLATADFDEDGVPDLVAGFAAPGGGLLVLHRGNVDALFPNAPEARGRDQKAPFLPGPEPINIPAVPEFLGAGDFNADGHWDLVLAARGGHVISYLLGD